MMPYLRIGGASCNLTPFDWDGNRQVLQEALLAAEAQGVQLVCLPELCLTSYDCQDGFYWKSLSEQAIALLQHLLPFTKNKVVTFGLPLWVGSRCYNGVVVVVNGQPIGIVCKQHLANQGVHYEARWFTPWPKDSVKTHQVGPWQLPIGDIVFDVGGLKIGFEICEDAWVLQRKALDFLQPGIQLILNPSASHFALGKLKKRQALIHAIIDNYPIAYVYCNQLGNTAGRLIYDGDLMIGHAGIIQSGPRFSFAPFELSWQDLSFTLGGATADEKAVAHWVTADMVWQSKEKPTQQLREAAWEKGPHVIFEECSRAIALGLFDLLRKTKTAGFVVNLSGGMDSTACVLSVWLMRTLAIQQLGHQAFMARVPQLKDTDYLTCLYQATQNSSETTLQAATQIAEAVNTKLIALDVQPFVTQYQQLAESVIGRALSWQTDDIALQNIQARVRAPGAWMIANLKNALLLATNNRSEAAMGYTTMDGDTAGVFCPIAGLDKAFIRLWLRWWQETGPADIGPFSQLQCVTEQIPTAELRPHAQNQTDENDLMPYEIIQAIGYQWLVLRKTPKDIEAYLVGQYPNLEVETLHVFVDKYFGLWAKSQWKRERIAPSFQLDDYNLCPKSGCRYPILSGKF
jgi:NAD+ synthase (glutamine-hydrolysing)